MIIRRAEPADAEQLMGIKNDLRMQTDSATANHGGFLLGTDVETYRFYITDALCLVAEEDKDIVGFGITLPDAYVRDSELWQKRQTVKWNIHIQDYQKLPLAYIEQLAFYPQFKRSAVALSYILIDHTFTSGAKVIFTTTVRKPVVNTAALALIRAAGGIHAGSIHEFYAEYGEIESNIYVITAQRFYEQVNKLNDRLGLESMRKWYCQKEFFKHEV